jgi:hypothetical protein
VWTLSPIVTKLTVCVSILKSLKSIDNCYGDAERKYEPDGQAKQ